MIVQACINGARTAGYHPNLPLTVDAMVRDGIASIQAGAAELHIHPRDDAGRESLSAVDDTIRAMRRACPGTLIGVSTGAWIEADAEATKACIAAWHERPDYASVNLSEPDAHAVMALLHRIGVGIEAGLATIADAERLVSLPDRPPLFRVLIEVEEQDIEKADKTADGIAQILADARISRSILLHGFDATVWHFVRRARERRWSTRVGLEDGLSMPDGTLSSGNADLVATAVAIFARVEG